MAESAEMYGYLDSLAKGMSKAYGLGASKVLIERLFTNYLHRTTAIESNSIYTRISLLDPKAETLVEVVDDLLEARDRRAGAIASGNAWLRPGKIEFPTNHAELRMAQACYYKATNFAGQIVAGIIPGRFSELLQTSSAATAAGQAQFTALRLRQENRFYPPEAMPEFLRRDVVERSDTVVDHGVLVSDRYLICGYRLKSQDAVLISVYDLLDLSGYLPASGGLLVISVAILGGAILIFLLNTRSLVLKVRLDESMVRHREVEEKNRLLELQIQERHKAEAALSKSEQNYREIFNATTDAIFIHRAQDGGILDVNDAMLEMYGYTREEVPELTLGRLSLEGSPFQESDALERIHQARTEGAQVFEWQSRRKQGEGFWVEVALRSSSIGGQGCVLAVVRDITERKRAQAEREKLEVQLRQAQKMEAVGQLAGGVAHDFNNLLQVIHGNNEIVLSETPPNSSAHEPLNEVKLAAERAASLVRQLPAFSRRVPLVLEPVDLILPD